MNKRVKRKWLKALRSGEYAQGQAALCREGEGYDRFCCLGVLCDLYSYETGELWEGCRSGALRMHGRTGVLPEEVKHWAGLRNTDPAVRTSPKRLRALSEINDSSRGNFRRIADLIEAQL